MQQSLSDKRFEQNSQAAFGRPFSLPQLYGFPF